MKMTDLIGNTPMALIQRLNPNPNVELWVKLEGNNPGGSVKDRAAFNMINQALLRGDIQPGMQLIEATSGNTGIALAMVSSMLGIKMTLVMPASATRERVLTMEAFGATVILTDAKGGMEAAIDYANAQVATGDFFALNQFGNPDNWGAHYMGTGPEIWRDTQKKITHFVSAMGTTGTIMGTSRFLKEQNPNIQIVGAQPTDGSSIPGIRRWPQEYLPKIFEPARVDRIIDVAEIDARKRSQEMAKIEGIFAGMSSGGALHAALQLCTEIDSGVIVSIACDRGDRYLSTDLFSR